MHQIYPISLETCRPYIGSTVCAVLHDGTHYVGTIAGVSAAGIEFSGASQGASVLATQPNKAKKQLQNLKSKAKTSAYGFGGTYGGYGYGTTLDWAAIALLFLLPFFFI
ncbi:MAG TPA: hypothetical protein VGE40_14700 [Bacilli bacterium]